MPGRGAGLSVVAGAAAGEPGIVGGNAGMGFKCEMCGAGARAFHAIQFRLSESPIRFSSFFLFFFGGFFRDRGCGLVAGLCLYAVGVWMREINAVTNFSWEEGVEMVGLCV